MYRRISGSGVSVRYAFIKDNSDEYPVRLMCKCLKLHHSGYYVWLETPLSNRAIENRELLENIKF